MDAPLIVCTFVEQRAVIRFLWAEGVKPVEIHKRMLAQYGSKCLGQRKVYEWIGRFKSGRTNVNDRNRSKCTSHTQVQIDHVNTSTQEDGQYSVSALSDMFDVSCDSESSVMHDTSEYKNFPVKCTSKQSEVIQKSVESMDQLYPYNKYKTLLENFLTKDETWVHYFDTESRKRILEWKYSPYCMNKKFKGISSSYDSH